MEKLLNKYARKLVEQGLCNPGTPLLGGLDADLVWNRHDKACRMLEDVVHGMNINSILFAKPAEPYFSLLNYLCRNQPGAIYPEDCETRTFLHDIPVSEKFSAPAILEALKKRKSVVIPNHGIVTFGTVSPEQAFVTYSSVCFSGFVKFFNDYLTAVTRGKTRSDQEEVYTHAMQSYQTRVHSIQAPFDLMQGPFSKTEAVIQAMIEAGRLTVDSGMVDSYFGNISYRLDDTIYISETGGSLDELAGCIDPCPLDGSSCAGITASSEFTAHKDILTQTENKAILHGHPKFSVILSMHCETHACPGKETCHLKCPETRYIQDIPIVPGEVGTGPHGLYRTLPPAIQGHRGAIVYGHGLFTVGKEDFREAFESMVNVEKICIEEYLNKVR